MWDLVAKALLIIKELICWKIICAALPIDVRWQGYGHNVGSNLILQNRIDNYEHNLDGKKCNFLH